MASHSVKGGGSVLVDSRKDIMRAGPSATAVSAAATVGVSALCQAIIGWLDEEKAEEIVAIPLAGKTSIADDMVIATGRSTRQVAALADKVADRLRSTYGIHVKMEGLAQADWVVIDANHVLVHLFRPEVRAFYNLEKMWSVDGPLVEDKSERYR